MREIKFRAWVKNDWPYRLDTEPEYYMDYDPSFPVRVVAAGATEEIASLNEGLTSIPHLMQYTDLKDCKGNEIYEGDILRVDWNDTRYPIHITGPVEWDTRHACWQLGEGGTAEDDAKHHMEVIGNIYQTSELLIS